MASKLASTAAGAFAIGLAVSLVGPGCGESPAPPEAPPSADAKPPEGPATQGGRFEPAMATATIRVRAVVKGTLPATRTIKVDGDPVCARQHTDAAVPDPSIVAYDGRLANVIVYVSKGAERWTCPTSEEAVLLDQKGCMYEPHVFTVQVNQPITIRNSDATLHNIHAVPQKNGEFNKSQSSGAADMTERFAKEEVGVRIKCDVHGWMSSFAGVFSHPFHGVTKADGTTTLKVPPGEYEVSSWQESGKLAKPGPQTVTVAEGETKEIEFVYSVK